MTDCRIIKYRDTHKAMLKLLKTPYSTFPSIEKNNYLLIQCEKEEYLFPYENKLKGALIESLGRNADGGLIPLSSNTRYYSDALIGLLRHVLNTCVLVTVTIRPWNYVSKIDPSILKNEKIHFIETNIYPRILYIKKSFEDYFTKISKKARNRYRYFIKNNGYVEKVSPRNYIAEILKINYSDPRRQGRPLPKSYLDPVVVKDTVEKWEKYIRYDMADFYIARIKGVVVGYAFVPRLNKHAFVSRFMIHKSYMRYGVSNGLLLEIIRDLSEKRKASIIQYGYWRKANSGINHFLEQHLFTYIREKYIIFYKKNKIFPFLLEKLVELSNTSNPGKLRILLDIISRK